MADTITATDEHGNTASVTVATPAPSTDWRGFPWTAVNGDDPVNSANALYMNGPVAGDPGGPYDVASVLNNGYSLIPDDPTGLTSTRAMFCMVPGDAGWVAPPAAGTHDTRAELTLAGARDTRDVMANASWDTIFVRMAVMVPSRWTAPVLVQNAQRSGWLAYQRSQNDLAQWPDGLHVNPATGDLAASSVVTNAKAQIIQVSNHAEDYGPTVFGWFRGQNSGINGQLESLIFQPVSLGVGLTTLNVDPINIAFDTRYDVFTEIKPGLYATSGGLPWIVPAGTITAPRTTAWSATNPVAPYGVPPGVPGGGYFRHFRWMPADPTYGPCWRCMTEGSPYAIGGQAPVYDAAGSLLNASTVVANAGMIFGPTRKGNGASLQTAITAGAQPPFDVVTTAPVAATGYRPQGGTVSLNGELMTFATADNTLHKLHVTARAIHGTSPMDHAAGEQVVGLIDVAGLSVGVNQAGYKSATNYGLSAPYTVAMWPPRVSRSHSFVCGAPAANYP